MSWTTWRRKRMPLPRKLAGRGRFHPQVETLESRLTPAAFTPGNLVIYRVGNAGSASASEVFLDEYTTAGTLVQTVNLSATGTNALTVSGSSAAAGGLTLSANREFLLLPGYRKDAGSSDPSADTAAATPRVIGRVGFDGTIDTSTALTDAFSMQEFRGVASTNGTRFWVSGGPGADGGVRFAGSLGATTSTSLSQNAADDLRGVAIFNGNLYISSAEATPGRGVFQVGSGLPETGSQTYTSLISLGTGNGINSFFLADLNAGVAGVDTLYVANSTANVLEKYSLVGTTWTLNNSASLTGIGFITATVSGSTVNLFVTTTTSFQSLTDTAGYNANLSSTTFTALVSATGTNAFRGVALTPLAPNQPPVNTLPGTYTGTE